jgi:hypothetical protein
MFVYVESVPLEDVVFSVDDGCMVNKEAFSNGGCLCGGKYQSGVVEGDWKRKVGI